MCNTLCNGLIKNNNPKSPIQYFELITVREYDDYENGTIVEQVKDAEHFLTESWASANEPFYRIYGKRYADDVISHTIFLGEFNHLKDAKQFLYYLTGEIPDILSY